MVKAHEILELSLEKLESKCRRWKKEGHVKSLNEDLLRGYVYEEDDSVRGEKGMQRP